MAKPYFDTRSKHLRLNGSICMWRGEPKYVQTERIYNQDPRELGEFQVILYPLDGIGRGTPEVANYTDPQFSVEPPLLGYANSGRKAHYITRLPARVQIQGLSRGNLKTDLHPFSTEMINCIKGVYFTYQEALATVTKGLSESVAFHRYLAVEIFGRSRVVLKHRDRLVGWKTLEDERFIVFKAGDNCPVCKLLTEAGVPHDVEGSDNKGSSPSEAPIGALRDGAGSGISDALPTPTGQEGNVAE